MTSQCDQAAPTDSGGQHPPSVPLGRPESTAFDHFFRAEYPRTVRLAHLLTGSNAVAEELAQDAFARMFPRFATIDEPAAYLRVTTLNVCRNWLRHRHREQGRYSRHGVTPVNTVELPPGEDELLAVIAELPYRQRAVLVMRYWLDLTEADIAASLGCRPGTVKSLHSRALATIRKELP